MFQFEVNCLLLEVKTFSEMSYLYLVLKAGMSTSKVKTKPKGKGCLPEILMNGEEGHEEGLVLDE